METVTVNGTLSITFPDGFRKLSEEEMRSLKYAGGGSVAVLRNEDRHMIANLGFKKLGWLPSLLLNEKTLAQGAEKAIAKASREYGYHLLGFQERTAGGKSGPCFHYTYQAQGIDMIAECCVIKAGGAYYYLYAYIREKYKEEGFRYWQEILDQARWRE